MSVYRVPKIEAGCRLELVPDFTYNSDSESKMSAIGPQEL